MNTGRLLPRETHYNYDSSYQSSPDLFVILSKRFRKGEMPCFMMLII